jgi:hypothetical protein
MKEYPVDVSSVRTLSKSDFILASGCKAKLWFRENGFPDKRDNDPYLRMLAYGGYMVEALANTRYPEAIALEYGGNFSSDCERTVELLSRDNVTLFQGTLLDGRRLARVDVIDKRGNDVRLIEVKAKSFDSVEHAALIAAGGGGVFRQRNKKHLIDGDWKEKLSDVTFQTILLEKLLPGVTVIPYVALVDKSKRSGIDNAPQLFRITTKTRKDGSSTIHNAEFIGTPEQAAALDLITEVCVADEVEILRDEISAAIPIYESMLDTEFDRSWGPLTAECRKCEFKHDDQPDISGFHYCWRDLATITPHVLDLYSAGRLNPGGVGVVESLVRQGKASLFDVPEDCMVRRDGKIGPVAARQRRQIECTRSGKVWCSPDLKEAIAKLQYPLHFVDFEVSRIALPYHSRMRPYGQLTFQWSCHTVTEPGGVPVHSEWLNTENTWPNYRFALALRKAIGDGGTILTWSRFEGSTLRDVDAELAAFDAADDQLTKWIGDAISRRRMVDLCEWCAKYFYHPAMNGRTSIKVVMDALWKSDERMRSQFTKWTGVDADAACDPYASLPAIEINGIPQDVREGTGAMRAYEAMMYGIERDDELAKKHWADLLTQYCELDTLSMVLILEHWARLWDLKDNVRVAAKPSI